MASRPGDWYCANCQYWVFASKSQCGKCGASQVAQDGEGYGGQTYQDQFAAPPSSNERPGDWPCPNGHGMQFAWREQCRICQVPKPGSTASHGYSGGQGQGQGQYQAVAQPHWSDQGTGQQWSEDWTCPSCASHNFAKRQECFRCRAPKGMAPPMMQGGGYAPPGGGYAPYPDHFQPHQPQQQQQHQHHAGRPGDWLCPNGHGMQFASRDQCRFCQCPNPGTGMAAGSMPPPTAAPAQRTLAGDWTCSACSSHNFARRDECFRCKAAKGDSASVPTQPAAPTEVYLSGAVDVNANCAVCNRAYADILLTKCNHLCLCHQCLPGLSPSICPTCHDPFNPDTCVKRLY
jgi:hypothetical protein